MLRDNVTSKRNKSTSLPQGQPVAFEGRSKSPIGRRSIDVPHHDQRRLSLPSWNVHQEPNNKGQKSHHRPFALLYHLKDLHDSIDENGSDQKLVSFHRSPSPSPHSPNAKIEERFLQLPESKDYEKLVSFSLDSTRGRLVNRGYCYRRKKVENADENGEGYLNHDSIDETNQLQEYTVLVVGGTTVGKSSLIRQLLDCDPSNLASDRDSEFDDRDDVTKKLRVLVLGRECEICFTECDIDEGLDFPLNDHFDSAIVLYSVTNEGSFQLATDVLNQIRNHCEREFPIFLLANKIDLQRQRIISTQNGRELAENFDCKFIEASIELGCETEDLLSEMLSELNPKCEESALVFEDQRDRVTGDNLVRLCMRKLSGKGGNRKKMSYPEASVQYGRRSPIIPDHDRKYSLSVETAKLCTRLARSCEDLFSKLHKAL